MQKLTYLNSVIEQLFCDERLKVQWSKSLWSVIFPGSDRSKTVSNFQYQDTETLTFKTQDSMSQESRPIRDQDIGISGSFTFHKPKLRIIYINLLPNSVFEDPFHHFHGMSNNLIPL